MPNSEHVKLLLKGVDVWNARRKKEKFKPDLSGVNIDAKFLKAGIVDARYSTLPLSGINLEDADLRETTLFKEYPRFTSGNINPETGPPRANLQNSKFVNSDLRESVFRNVNFDGADFRHANLCGADMSYSTFRGVDFSGANLENANLRSCHCADAKFTHSCLRGAFLQGTGLQGSNLSVSQPWKAYLYYYKTSNQVAPSFELIKCVSNLLGISRTLGNIHEESILFFRGENSNSWKLQPYVMRVADHHRKERERITDLITKRPEDFQNTKSTLDQLIRAQHHGLKTRLLDITSNPLVALFWASFQEEEDENEYTARLHVFAVPKNLVKSFNSDTISILSNFAKLSYFDQNLILGRSEFDIIERTGKDGFHLSYKSSMNNLYRLIRKENPNFEKRIDPRVFYQVFVIKPKLSFERIRAQGGAFLISAFHERFERDEILAFNNGIPIYNHYTLEVPHKSKARILDELSLYHITPETLLPGLDASAKAVNDYHEKSAQ